MPPALRLKPSTGNHLHPLSPGFALLPVQLGAFLAQIHRANVRFVKMKQNSHRLATALAFTQTVTDPVLVREQ